MDPYSQTEQVKMMDQLYPALSGGEGSLICASALITGVVQNNKKNREKLGQMLENADNKFLGMDIKRRNVS
ncbi:MAG: hypothetical protein WC838_06725 [Candidatus Margulisiibacteriota bacterium]|jgi:hypothetical protein